MPILARILPLVVLVLAPAWGEEDDDGGTTGGTMSLPDGVTAAAAHQRHGPGA